MAIKKLPGQDPKPKQEKIVEQSDDKPNIREFIKTHSVKDGIPFAVQKAKLTMSGWLIVETTHWVGFIHGKSAVAVALMTEIAPALHGRQGNQLIALVAKKSKFGFVLATDDEVKRWYDLNKETDTLEITEEQQESFLLPTGILSLEDFIGTPST
jgi:hypothetical protein